MLKFCLQSFKQRHSFDLDIQRQALVRAPLDAIMRLIRFSVRIEVRDEKAASFPPVVLNRIPATSAGEWKV